MQIGSPTGLDLVMIDDYRPVTGHDAEQLPLLGSLSATNARANRSGHRDRLTWQRIPSIPIAYGAVRRRHEIRQK
jgi:hypothetical protein